MTASLSFIIKKPTPGSYFLKRLLMSSYLLVRLYHFIKLLSQIPEALNKSKHD